MRKLLSILLLAGNTGYYFAWTTGADAQVVTNPTQTAIACAYNTSPPVVSTNKYVLVQCDSSGHMVITSQSTGSTGTDNSANSPAYPNVGANYGGAGSYANYFLIATASASLSRLSIDVENTSGAQIAIVLDDGIAANGAAPLNATVFALAGGGSVGSQGGSWVSLVEKGRVQVYSAITTALTFTGSLTAATSGTLNAAWTGPTGNVNITFSTGGVQLASFTNGSTAVTWPSAVTATASASAATAQVAVRQN